MADLYVRINDRLIYRQTIMAWCPALQIKEIVAVDDTGAKNPILRTIIAAGIPGTYKAYTITTEETREILKKPGSGNRLVIVKQPEALTALKEEIAGTKAVMLGNPAKKEGSRHKLDRTTGIFYLNDRDVETLDGFTASGLDVFFHQLPTSARTAWEAFRRTI